MNKFNQLIAGLALCGVAFGVSAFESKHSQRGVTCQVCHGTAAPVTKAKPTVCMTCHQSYEQLAKKTAQSKPNPHDSHAGQIKCTKCHREHSNSVLYCNECHQFQFKTP